MPRLSILVALTIFNLCFFTMAPAMAQEDLQEQSRQILFQTMFRLQAETLSKDQASQKVILNDMQMKLETLKAQGLTREDLTSWMCSSNNAKEFQHLLASTPSKDLGSALFSFFIKDRSLTEDVSYALSATALILLFEGRDLLSENFSS